MPLEAEELHRLGFEEIGFKYQALPKRFKNNLNAQNVLDSISTRPTSSKVIFAQKSVLSIVEAMLLSPLSDYSAGDPRSEAAISQLGDAVADAYFAQGEAQAFALGSAVLENLTQLPSAINAETVLRMMWIDMLEMGCSLPLLRDLLGEWTRLWPVQEFPAIGYLHDILQAWLHDLSLPEVERLALRKTLDTDLATTLTELEKELSVKTKQRLGMLKPA
jgi:hypothetical protein